MKSFYVQVPTAKGIFFIDLVSLALADMGFQRNVDYTPEKPLELTDDQKKTLEKKLTSKFFRKQAVKSLETKTFDEIFEAEVDPQFIPFVPDRQYLKEAFDDHRLEDVKVVTQLDEVPYLKIDGFDADIKAEEEAQAKRKLASKTAQAMLNNQSKIADPVATVAKK